MHVFSKKRRSRLRDLAREEYYIASKLSANPDNTAVIKKLAIRNARQRLVESGEYGGFFSAILLSIAIKIIIKLIEHWIDENLSASDVPETYQLGEPGYV
jgi:hypothetical protein